MSVKEVVGRLESLPSHSGGRRPEGAVLPCWIPRSWPTMEVGLDCSFNVGVSGEKLSFPQEPSLGLPPHYWATKGKEHPAPRTRTADEG